MSSAGGAKIPAGLIETTLAELDLARGEREQEAEALDRGGHASMSLALRLYALEIRLKAMICRRLNLAELPRACKTHDLSELIIFTGLLSELFDPANAGVSLNWQILADISKQRLNDLRYQPRISLDEADRLKLERALDDPDDGVILWLSRPR